jgi:hypothetical protein
MAQEVWGMEVSEARRLRELEEENARLKRLVADQVIDIQPEGSERKKWQAPCKRRRRWN